jgi:Protein of unknown function (DUF3617)
MRKVSRFILSLPMLSAAAFAWAAGQTKPGLWEMTIRSDAMKNMPKMSPEQMEQMEQMRRMGINMPQMQGNGMVTKVCISKEMAESDELPAMAQKEAGCQVRNMQRNAGGYSMDIVCDGSGMKGEGKAKGSFSGDSSFASTYDFKGTMHGQPVDQHHETSGKWLSADCGNIKPIGNLMPGK